MSFLFAPLVPVCAFALGFLGMQREWYATAFAGVRPSARRIWFRTWRYFVRFLPVGIVALVGFPLLIGWVVIPLVPRSASYFNTVRPRIEITTANPFKAFGIGMRHLRHAWRAVKWHALVTPMAIIVIGQIIAGHRTDAAHGIATTLLGVMLNLLFKGAQLRAYLAHADELGVTIDSRTVVTAPSLPSIWARPASILKRQ